MYLSGHSFSGYTNCQRWEAMMKRVAEEEVVVGVVVLTA